MNVHVLYVLERKTSTKKFPYVYLSVRLSAGRWVLSVETITFEEVTGFKQNLVGVLYV